jgi:hypothetical protein
MMKEMSATPEEAEHFIWKHINQAFSEPVTDSDNTADYIPTQILAERFKRDGYEGVIYTSHL